MPTDREPVRPGRLPSAPEVERRTGNVTRFDGRSGLLMHYPAVVRPGEDVLFPAHEGFLGGGHAIDKHGDPDLMAEFAGEYLKQYRAIVPMRGLPRRLSEMMPALHLLVNATELALKADLIRSDKDSGGHSLVSLYGRLEADHRAEIERRFAVMEPNANLSALGCEAPNVESVLQAYGSGFGWSPAYEETRYFAEPTTRIRRQDGKGGNLVKSTPYPIFLPHAVAAMLAGYAHFSGAARLKRLGGTVAYGSRDRGNDNHGDWGLVPASLGLLVIRVGQLVATDKSGAERTVFRRFVEEHPPGYRTEWMYGGNRLLFYRAAGASAVDEETEIDGMPCRAWSEGCLGLHARDLYRLADVLEAEQAIPAFEWPPSA
ncbi:MAG: hypothetical protein OXH15_06905 [Gammaproteobacteria bacterium]|nr:hypothetical protein [Gammaproteobacteria bacterium]